MRPLLSRTVLSVLLLSACGGKSETEGNDSGGAGSSSTGARSADVDSGTLGADEVPDSPTETSCGTRFCFDRSHAPVGPGAKDLELLDCDGDGGLDVVVANSKAGTISVLRGTGDGTFESQRTYLSGQDPWTLSSADVDDDGDVDLTVGNFIYGAHVLFGDDDCGFDRNLALFGDDPLGQYTHGGRAVALGDVTGDGIVDALASMVSDAGFQGQIAVFEGRGDGTFEDFVTHPTDTTLGELVVRDVDDDGRNDIVGLTERLAFGNPSVQLLAGEAGGTLASSVSHTVLSEAGSLAIEDFDEDGLLDVATNGGASVSFLRARKDGFDAQVTFAMHSATRHLAAGDLDEDGHLDLVVTLGADNQVAILAGNGDGSFEPPITFESGAYSTMNDNQEPNYVKLGDLDEDGDVDIVVSNFQGEVTIFLNRR